MAGEEPPKPTTPVESLPADHERALVSRPGQPYVLQRVPAGQLGGAEDDGAVARVAAVADDHAHRSAAELQAESTAVAGVLAGSHRARLTSRHRGQVQRPTEDRGTGPAALAEQAPGSRAQACW